MRHLNTTFLELYYCRFPSFTNRGWGCHKRKVPTCSVAKDFLFHLLHSLEEKFGFQGNFPLQLQLETCECDLECVVLWHSCDLKQSESCETETSRESHFSPDKEIPLIFACLAHTVTFESINIWFFLGLPLTFLQLHFAIGQNSRLVSFLSLKQLLNGSTLNHIEVQSEVWNEEIHRGECWWIQDVGQSWVSTYPTKQTHPVFCLQCLHAYST